MTTVLGKSVLKAPKKNYSVNVGTLTAWQVPTTLEAYYTKLEGAWDQFGRPKY